MEIIADNVTVRIDGRNVLEEQSVRAEPGATLALVGPSGCGKTTLLNVLGLLRRPDGGRVLAGGKDTSAWKDGPRRHFWQRHAAFIFQDYGLIDEESVAYNVALAKLSMMGSTRRRTGAIDNALEQVGLGGRSREKVSRLSGGEKQRVSLARAIFRSADVILADEPTASLDHGNRELVTRFLKAEAARGVAVVIATHDEELMGTCDRVHRL